MNRAFNCLLFAQYYVGLIGPISYHCRPTRCRVQRDLPFPAQECDMYYSAETNASRFKYVLAHHDGDTEMPAPRAGLDAGRRRGRTAAPLALDSGAYTPPSCLGELMDIGGREDMGGRRSRARVLDRQFWNFLGGHQSTQCTQLF